MALPDYGNGDLQTEMALEDDEKLGQQIQMELNPGDKIWNATSGQCFLYSGSIINGEQGITVAHAIVPGNGVAIKPEPDSDVSVQVGRCRATFEKLQRPGGGQLTADVALVELDTAVCSVGNTVWWPNRGGRPFQIKVYEGQEIPKDATVMILDQNGHFHIGCIHRTHLTNDGLNDVMGICASENEVVSITQPGDSGALVMSIPNSEDDILFVYGIVIGISKNLNDNTSMTIANSLPKVIQEIGLDL